MEIGSFLISTVRKFFSPAAETPPSPLTMKMKMMMMVLVFGLMSDWVFFSPSEKATSSNADSSSRGRRLAPLSLWRTGEGRRDGALSSANKRRQDTQRAVDLTPWKHTERGYRWSCTKEKQIMRRQEVLQPPSGLSADQSAVGEDRGREETPVACSITSSAVKPETFS